MTEKAKCPHGGDWSIGCEEFTCLQKAEKLVKKQAKDERLWFIVETAAEAYLQQELRKLHEAIEGKSQKECARDFLRGKGN